MFVFMSLYLVTSAGCYTDGEKETFSTGLLQMVWLTNSAKFHLDMLPLHQKVS